MGTEESGDFESRMQQRGEEWVRIRARQRGKLFDASLPPGPGNYSNALPTEKLSPAMLETAAREMKLRMARSAERSAYDVLLGGFALTSDERHDRFQFLAFVLRPRVSALWAWLRNTP